MDDIKIEMIRVAMGAIAAMVGVLVIANVLGVALPQSDFLIASVIFVVGLPAWVWAKRQGWW